MGKAVVPVADDHIGPARHRRMHRMLGEHFAEHRIGTVRGKAADQIGWVEIFHAEVELDLLAPGGDLLLQELADVVVQHVAGLVAAAGFLFEEMLPGPFRNDDHRVLALPQPSFQTRQQRVLPLVEAEGVLRHQAVVDMGVRQRRIGGDEAGITPHHMDQSDSVRRPFRLVVRGGNHRIGRIDRRLEAEGLVDIIDVVVDRLRDADHADIQSAPFDLLDDVVGAAQRAVAADAEEDLDVHALERFDHHHLVLPAAGAAEHGAADLVDAVHRIGRKHHRLMSE